MEHHGALGIRAFHMATVQTNGAFGDLIEASGHRQNRRFTATRVTDQGDELALVNLEIKVLNDRQRAFWRRVDFIELREVQEPVFNKTLLSFSNGRRNTMDRCHIRQDTRAFDLSFDTDVHQVFGDIAAQGFEGFVVIHLHPVTRTRDGDFELITQRAIWVQRDDPIGEDDRLVHVIGDQNTGFLVFVPDRLDLIGKVGTGQRIKGGERLIEEQHLWVHRQGAGHVHALAHSAREFCWTPRCRMAEAYHFDVVVDLCGAFLFGKLREHRVDSERHVSIHREPRHQRVALEDHAALAPGFLNRLTFESNGAGCWHLKPRHQVDQSGLAGAGEAEDDDKLTLLNF